MEIVILDADTIGSDINLSEIERFGNLTIYQTTNSKQICPRIQKADIIITNKVIIGKGELECAKSLKMICVAATGYNNIDISETNERKIVVANVKNYSTESVAQHTISLILAIENSTIEYANESKSGNWSKSTIFTMLNHPINELKSKKLGLIGYGNIGKRVAELAGVFGMKVLIGKRPGVEYSDYDRVDFEYLISKSDIITIHSPLSENTKDLFTMNEFKKMKDSAIIINTARGGIINEKDLFLALKERLIRIAAIDVTETEPIDRDNPLLKLDNIIITPHVAWASRESRTKLVKGIADNIKKFKEGRGHEINVVK